MTKYLIIATMLFCNATRLHAQDLHTVTTSGNSTSNVLRLTGQGNIGSSGGAEMVLGLFSTNITNDTRCFVGWKNSGYTNAPGLAGSLLLQARSDIPCPILFATGAGTPSTRMTIAGNGNVGINVLVPNANAKLDVDGNIFTSGKIAIGITDMTKINPYSLAVNGTAIFTKAIVKSTSSWPDYVFTPTYNLPKLDSLEQFIKLNGHLPEIPKAEEVEKNGIDLGNNQALLLKKIEELTLFAIEQNKRFGKLQKIIEEQDKRNEEQSQEITKLEKELKVLQQKNNRKLKRMP